MKIKEVTGEDIALIEKIADLEKVVLKNMIKDGKEGQLFITGFDDILEYAKSEQNTVLVSMDENEELLAATYITQGQTPFTYNDITKYFKVGEKYNEYVRKQYKDNELYKKDLIDIFKIKLEAFEYAKNKILEEHKEFKNINEFLKKEVQENGFHEKSELREKINEYMSNYIIEKYDEKIQKKYEQFYWITSKEIQKEFKKDVQKTNEKVQEYDSFINVQLEYEQIIQYGKLKIYETPNFDESVYYTANTSNSIEIDTYITNPNNRSSGIARIIVFEGIKKHIVEYFKNSSNTEIFLCSTLHRSNLSSKYVSEFFGLTDSLFVNRRKDRDREVHICRIARENAKEYLNHMACKLAVLYDYNPNDLKIDEQLKIDILKQQIKYEINEIERLRTAKTIGNLKGQRLNNIHSKIDKVRILKEKLVKLQEERTNGGR